MSAAYGPMVESAALPAPMPTVEPQTRADLRSAVQVAGALMVLGALLGVVWGLWSPPGPAAEVLGGGAFQPDETEAFIAGDGRFLVLTGAAGLVTAMALWFGRTGTRGAIALVGMAVGGLVGALFTELVGHLSGGGSFTGRTYHYADGSARQLTPHLPLSLHAHGLLFVEAALATLVYGMFVAFAARDDLGRSDARQEKVGSRAVDPASDGGASDGGGSVGGGSVGGGGQPYDGGGHGDAAGGLQERELPAQ